MVRRLFASNTVDAVPEFYHYEDTGCEASNSCLSCPLPQCKHDDPVWFQRNRRLARDFNVLTAMRLEHLSVDEAAERFSVTVRTIFRIMRRCRDAMPELANEELQAFAAD
ncbi:MAG: transposase family protein [Dehalococcoidia bacterium]